MGKPLEHQTKWSFCES